MKHKLLQLLGDNARADRSAPAVRADTSGDTAKVYVYDVIDSYWGASAKDLIDALQAAGDKKVDLHINSPGGDVFEARAMVAAVRAHAPGVTVYIDGLAASAATYLALSGQAVHIQEGAMFMVHNSWTITWGNKAELRSTADLLEKIDGTIAADYARKTSATAEQIAAWMDAETWFTAEEAKTAGFVDSVITGTSAQASAAAARWNLSAYAHPPKIQTSAQPPAPDETALSEQAARTARLNRSRLAALALNLQT
jgi:ATP-dependent Clp protease protease subunit